MTSMVLSACGGGSAGGGTSQPDTDTDPVTDNTGGATDDSDNDGADPVSPGTDDGDDGDDEPVVIVDPTSLDAELRALLLRKGFSPDELRTRSLPSPGDPLVELGKELFFSRSLSFADDVACASCHDPRLAGTDNLSLPVGIGAHDQMVVGPGRRHDGNFYIDPKADTGPNVPRNSPTTFNIAFYDRAMFWDGRVETVEFRDGYGDFIPVDSGLPNGEGASIRTPDSFSNGPDPDAGQNLTVAQARFPVTSVVEMRGFSASAGQTSQQIRNKITQKLADRGWELYFREAFDDYVTDTASLLSYDNIALALGEYQRSQVALDNPFFRYVDGDNSAISQSAVAGAIRFFDSAKGGCAECHSGPHFSDEGFYSLATPQIGRGKNSFSQDYGRYNVTRTSLERHSFRTPSLLNTELTEPYMHAGTLPTLADAIAWHFTPQASLQAYDYSLSQLPQFNGLGIDTSHYAELTPSIIASQAQQANASAYREKLRLVAADATALADYESFLKTLTSDCLRDFTCVAQWMPDFTQPDPDGMRLDPVLAAFDNSAVFSVTPPEPGEVDLASFPDLSDIPAYPFTACAISHVGSPVETDLISGFRLKDPLPSDRKIGDAIFNNRRLYMDSVLMSGSIASGDIDGDCDMDLLVDGGENAGILVMLNDGGEFSLAENNYGLTSEGDIAAFSLTDVNGDGWPDVFYGHLLRSTGTLWLNNGRGSFLIVPEFGFSSVRKTHNAAFGDVDGDGDLDMFTANWDFGQSVEEPHLWLNDGRGFFAETSGTGMDGDFGERDFTLSPNFADMNKDGVQDMVLASDFLTSQVYRGVGDGTFENDTDISVITDENGMGVGIGDIDNDGDLDWFVTNIYDAEVMSGTDTRTEGNWGATGNRLYRNDSVPGEEITFTDVTTSAGVRDGGWGWGVCMQDFDNDGWLDIFHVNGYGYGDSTFESPLFNALSVLGINSVYQLAGAGYSSADAILTALYNVLFGFDQINALLGHAYTTESELRDDLAKVLEGSSLLYSSIRVLNEFYETPARLFMNNGDGSFSEEAAFRNINDTGEGRGIVCNDFDRDGDIDIIILNHSGAPSYYENHFRRVTDLADNFINVTLHGTQGNPYGFGAKVYLVAGDLSQYRESRFENNYNSNNGPELHFGLAAENSVDSIRVEWPDGEVTTLTDVNVNQFLVIEHPSYAD